MKRTPRWCPYLWGRPANDWERIDKNLGILAFDLTIAGILTLCSLIILVFRYTR